MNVAAKKTADRTDYQARARARRADKPAAHRAATGKPYTLADAPSEDLSPEERRARIETTALAFVGL